MPLIHLRKVASQNICFKLINIIKCVQFLVLKMQIVQGFLVFFSVGLLLSFTARIYISCMKLR